MYIIHCFYFALYTHSINETISSSSFLGVGVTLLFSGTPTHKNETNFDMDEIHEVRTWRPFDPYNSNLYSTLLL